MAAAYHILASLQVKECNCKGKCRAKHGREDSKAKAEKKARELKSAAKSVASVATIAPTPADTAVSMNQADPPEPFEPPREADKIASPDHELFGEELQEAEVNEDNNVEDISEPEKLQDGEEKPSGDSYLDDDEYFLAGDDKILSVSKEEALFEQLDNVVSWRLLNFYDEDGKRKNRLQLRSDPPILRIESAAGEFAEIVLTRDLSATLAETFDTVKRGFYGVDARRKGMLTQPEAKNKFKQVTEYVTLNPIKSALLTLVIMLFLVAAFFS